MYMALTRAIAKIEKQALKLKRKSSTASKRRNPLHPSRRSRTVMMKSKPRRVRHASFLRAAIMLSR
jgi:hypothetical protein